MTGGATTDLFLNTLFSFSPTAQLIEFLHGLLPDFTFRVPGNPYGEGMNTDDGNVAVAESWAEFIGTNHAIRRYGNNSRKEVTSLFETDPFTGNIICYNLNTQLLENEFFFFGGDWIPYGFYHDLMDAANPTEPWDNVNGVTIRQLYLALGSDEDTMCDYLFNFMQQNLGINANDVTDIAAQHNISCF